jgi:hypothetical protein
MVLPMNLKQDTPHKYLAPRNNLTDNENITNFLDHNQDHNEKQLNQKQQKNQKDYTGLERNKEQEEWMDGSEEEGSKMIVQNGPKLVKEDQPGSNQG